MPLDITTLESWLWDAACAIRGPVDAPKFKDYILPLVFLRRLSDVFEDELERVGETGKGTYYIIKGATKGSKGPQRGREHRMRERETQDSRRERFLRSEEPAGRRTSKLNSLTFGRSGDRAGGYD